MLLRVGIPASFPRFSAAVLQLAEELGAPLGMLVSANALFDHKARRFRLPAYDIFSGGDGALDSAGFMAMLKYGGYPWSIEQYLDLVAGVPQRWYASMDFCCEPEIAANQLVVRERIAQTVANLDRIRNRAVQRGLPMPMPVLQGWLVDDYIHCVDLMAASGDWPDLVGLGSVCRRHINGPTGILAIVRELGRVLPPHVGLHLFGVKGPAVAALRGSQRVRSTDSMAWDREAAGEATKLRRDNPEFSCTIPYRIGHMRRWVSEIVGSLSATDEPTDQMVLPWSTAA